MTYKLTLSTEDGEVLNNYTLTLFAVQDDTLNMLRETDRAKLLDGICEDIVAVERTEA